MSKSLVIPSLMKHYLAQDTPSEELVRLLIVELESTLPTKQRTTPLGVSSSSSSSSSLANTCTSTPKNQETNSTHKTARSKTIDDESNCDDNSYTDSTDSDDSYSVSNSSKTKRQISSSRPLKNHINKKNKRLKRMPNMNPEIHTVKWFDRTIQVTWLNFEETILNLCLPPPESKFIFASQTFAKPTQRAFVSKYRWCYPQSSNLDLSRMCIWLQDGHETPAIHQMLSRLPQFLDAIVKAIPIESINF